MADLLMIGLGVDTRRLRDGERALGSLRQAGNRTEAALGRICFDGFITFGLCIFKHHGFSWRLSSYACHDYLLLSVYTAAFISGALLLYNFM